MTERTIHSCNVAPLRNYWKGFSAGIREQGRRADCYMRSFLVRKTGGFLDRCAWNDVLGISEELIKHVGKYLVRHICPQTD